MKAKILSLLISVACVLPVFSATIHGSRTGANEKSSGFFVEAFSKQGRVLYKSLKFDENGKFVLDFPTNEALVYWIDNFPVYVQPNENLEIILPERKSGAFVIGGPAEQQTASPGMVTETNIKLAGKSAINNLLINEINVAWANLSKEKKGAQTIAEIDQVYQNEIKLIVKSKDVPVNQVASFYNNLRYLEAKLQYLRAHPTEKVAKGFFNVTNKISLNNPAVNSLKSIGLRALVTNYYMFLKLSQGAGIKDEDLNDNSSLGKMEHLLKNVSNERIINEELNQSIVYHLSIKGWNPQLDKIMVAAIEKTTDVAAKKNLIDLREKYSKVSKNTIAPGFSIPDATGKMISLADFKGKVVAIDVWATWCIPCMHSLPYFLKIRDKYKDNPNVVLMSISTDNAESKTKWLNFLKSKNMNGVDLHAGDKSATAFEKAYNITGIPRYILIGKDGKIIEDHAVQASEPAYETLIQTALQEK
jgi:thiol-disulfide isomerase/thioredoxin